jgi:hypothetical protein
MMQYESPDNGTLTPVATNTSAYFRSGACYNALASLNLTVYYTWSGDDNSASGTSTIDKVCMRCRHASISGSGCSRDESARPQ